MSIITRLKKLESKQSDTISACRCPNAVAFVATDWGATCFLCDKAIVLADWEHWDVIHPWIDEDGQQQGPPAFAIARNDKHELRTYLLDKGTGFIESQNKGETTRAGLHPIADECVSPLR